MLEKLFHRLRSWRQGGLAAPSPASMLPTSPSGANGLATLAGPLTPPPIPADAWAESESGIVITDSGIIILGPATEPRTRPAMPTLPPAPVPDPAPAAAAPAAPPQRKLTPGELDWDDVLARARARAQEAGDSPPPVPSGARRTGKKAE
jgi:hypothetical protein